MHCVRSMRRWTLWLWGVAFLAVVALPPAAAGSSPEASQTEGGALRERLQRGQVVVPTRTPPVHIKAGERRLLRATDHDERRRQLQKQQRPREPPATPAPSVAPTTAAPSSFPTAIQPSVQEPLTTDVPVAAETTGQPSEAGDETAPEGPALRITGFPTAAPAAGGEEETPAVTTPRTAVATLQTFDVGIAASAGLETVQPAALLEDELRKTLQVWLAEALPYDNLVFVQLSAASSEVDPAGRRRFLQEELREHTFTYAGEAVFRDAEPADLRQQQRSALMRISKVQEAVQDNEMLVGVQVLRVTFPADDEGEGNDGGAMNVGAVVGGVVAGVCAVAALGALWYVRKRREIPPPPPPPLKKPDDIEETEEDGDPTQDGNAPVSEKTHPLVVAHLQGLSLAGDNNNNNTRDAVDQLYSSYLQIATTNTGVTESSPSVGSVTTTPEKEVARAAAVQATTFATGKVPRTPSEEEKKEREQSPPSTPSPDEDGPVIIPSLTPVQSKDDGDMDGYSLSSQPSPTVNHNKFIPPSAQSMLKEESQESGSDYASDSESQFSYTDVAKRASTPVQRQETKASARSALGPRLLHGSEDDSAAADESMLFLQKGKAAETTSLRQEMELPANQAWLSDVRSPAPYANMVSDDDSEATPVRGNQSNVSSPNSSKESESPQPLRVLYSPYGDESPALGRSQIDDDDDDESTPSDELNEGERLDQDLDDFAQELERAKRMIPPRTSTGNYLWRMANGPRRESSETAGRPADEEPRRGSQPNKDRRHFL